jgi:hypothetical protein
MLGACPSLQHHHLIIRVHTFIVFFVSKLCCSLRWAGCAQAEAAIQGQEGWCRREGGGGLGCFHGLG